MNDTPIYSIAPKQEYDDSPIGIVALWQVLWKNKLRIAIPAFVFAFLVGIFSIGSEETYTAEGQIILSRGNLEIIGFEAANGQGVSQSEVSNALTILGSRSLALEVIERTNLIDDPSINPNLSLLTEEPYPDNVVRQIVLDWLSDAIWTTSLPNSNVILVQATTNDPEKSAAIANAYIEGYLDYQMELGKEETDRAAQALKSRVNELLLQLEADEMRLQNFQSGAQNTVLSSAEALTSEAIDMRSQRDANQSNLAALEDAFEAINAVQSDDLTALRETIDQNEALGQLEQSVLGRPIAAEGLVDDVAAIKTALEAEKNRLAQLGAALRDGLAALETRIADVNAYNVRLRQLEVEIDTTSQVYETSLARLKELSIQTNLRDAGAQILARAEAPLRSDARGARTRAAIAGSLGLFLGIAYVLLREAANDRVRTLTELEDITGSDDVVQLPSAHSKLLRNRRFLRKVFAGATSPPFEEGVRALRHKLLTVSPARSDPMLVGIFSSLPKEGKTTITRALAKSFSMIDRRVLVIDGDMRIGTLSKTLGVTKDQPGLKDIMTDRRDPREVIKKIDGAGFDLLPSGQSKVNPADLLDSGQFGLIIAAISESYDVIFIDTPPILVLPDAPKIAQFVDVHILVADHDRSPKAALRESVAALRMVNVKNTVVALSNAPGAFGQNYGQSNNAYAAYWN